MLLTKTLHEIIKSWNICVKNAASINIVSKKTERKNSNYLIAIIKWLMNINNYYFRSPNEISEKNYKIKVTTKYW